MPDPIRIQVQGKLLTARVVAPPAGLPGASAPHAGAAESAGPTGVAGQMQALQQQLDEVRAEAEAEKQALQKQLQAQQAQLAQTAAALADGADQLSALREQVLAETREQVAMLAIEIARKVLCQEIAAGNYDIDPIVAEALTRVSGRQDVTVRLHPEDLARCGQAGGDDAAANGHEHVRFVADKRLGKGECLVETAQGVVEVSVEEQLAEAAEVLQSPEEA